jgi:hypothetical protein
MRRICIRSLAAFLVGPLCVLIASSAQASIGKKFGKSNLSPSGDFAFALGSAFQPRGIFLKVVTADDVSVSVTYSIECFRKRSTSKTRFEDGGFNTQGIAVLRIRQTYKRASKCVVSASATPFPPREDHPALRVQLFARH